MTQQYYVSRPTMKSDATALWLWLECSYPELLKEFRVAFNRSAAVAAQARAETPCPKLVEYLAVALAPKEA